MKWLIAFIFGVLVFFSGMAQAPSRSISGVVKDTTDKPVPGASVALTLIRDSSLYKTAVTDAGGKFILTDLKSGRYQVSVTGVGYERYQSDPLVVDDKTPSFVLSPLKLKKAAGELLQEVAVTVKRPLIEQQIDRLVVNVDAMIGNAGSNALEVLSKSPGITVSNDGSISLNGKSGVMVIIDGRSTYLSQQDLANYLKSIPAGTLDKIEIMSNPPARYDASGNAVINIKLKKNKASGFNGSISLGYSQGVYMRSNDAINLNYRTKKFNVFSSLSYANDRDYGDEGYDRFFYNDRQSLISTVQMETRYRYVSNSLNARMGMDYFISPKTTIGVVLTGITRPKNDRLDYNSTQFDNTMKLDSAGTGYIDGKYKWRNGGVNLNYQHSFDSLGRELTADFDYIRYDSHGDQLSQNFVNRQDGGLINKDDILYVLPAGFNIYSAKADYVHPLKNKMRFEAGMKSSYVNTDNATSYYNIEGGGMIPDYGKTNHFVYRENINSIYVNTNKEWKRWSAQLGLRVENTQSNGHQLGNVAVSDSSFTKSYTGLFPTTFISYKLDSSGNNTLVLSYGRRIWRPDYQQLNPFLFFHDKYSYTAGNPYLNASYNNNVELSYRYKQYFGITVFYDQNVDMVFQSTRSEGSLFITRPENIADAHMLGFYGNVSLSPFKWWSFNVNGHYVYMVNQGPLNTEYVNQRTATGGVFVLNQFKFSKGWSAELSGFYGGRWIEAQTIVSPRKMINAAAQKTFWKEKASLKLTLNDIFHSLIIHDRTTNIKQSMAFHTNETDTRRIGLVFSYRFGKDANARKRNHNTGGADAEQGRVK